MKKFLKKNIKNIFLYSGLLLILVSSIYKFIESAEHIDINSFILVVIFSIAMFLILSFGHKHTKKSGDVKMIVLSEFIHSLMDGVVIGAAFIVSPILGFSTLLGILVHESPKIIGTFLLLKSILKNNFDTIKYSLLCQAGIPVSFSIIYFLKSTFNEVWQERIELLATVSLLVIVSRIFYHTITHRSHTH